MPFVTVNGVKLHLQELGEGPPVVMIHGLFVGTLASWFFTAAPRLSQKRHVVMYDLRGHGLSDVPTSGYDVATHVRDFEGVLEATQVEAQASRERGGKRGPVSLVGHSFGALIALRFALANPGRVDRLALVEPPLPPSRFQEFNEFLERSPEEMLEALPLSLRRAVESGGRSARRLIRHVVRLAQETSLLADLRAEQDETDSALRALTLPTLCVFGEDSSLRPVGERLAKAIPNSRLVLLRGGHYLHLDATEALTRTLEEFLPHG